MQRVVSSDSGNASVTIASLAERGMDGPVPVSGLAYDSGDSPHVLERALALEDWDGFEARRLPWPPRCLMRCARTGSSTSTCCSRRSVSGALYAMRNGREQERNQVGAVRLRQRTTASKGYLPKKFLQPSHGAGWRKVRRVEGDKQERVERCRTRSCDRLTL